MRSGVSIRPTLRVAPALALSMLLAFVPGSDARGQTPEEAAMQPAPAAEKPPVEHFAKPMGPPAPNLVRWLDADGTLTGEEFLRQRSFCH